MSETQTQVPEIVHPFFTYSVKTNKATHVGGTMISTDVDDAGFDKMVEQLKKEAAHITEYNKEKFVSLIISDNEGVVKEFTSLDA